MFNLIVVVAMVWWVVYRTKKKKRIFPEEFFLPATPSEEPVAGWFALIVICVVICGVYIGSYKYIKIYDVKETTINHHESNIAQLETQVDELDAEIEDISSNTELSVEEKIERLVEHKINKIELEAEIIEKREKIAQIQQAMNPKLYKLYKFLLYFES